MAYARLRIDKYLEGEHLAGGAIVDVRRLDKGPAGKPSVTRTTAPMGMAGSGAESRLDLDPGTYEFTAILPSGDVLSRVAVIDAQEGGVPVVFEMDQSPHEWMSWQHALGNVVGGETLRMMRAQDRIIHWSLVDDVDAQLFETRRPFFHLPLDRFERLWADYVAYKTGSRWFPFNNPVVVGTLPSLHDPPYKVYRIPPSNHFDYEDSAFVRSYVLVGDKSNRQVLCVLPYPWRKASMEEATVELLVGPDQPLDADQAIAQSNAPWSVSTIAHDGEVASVLSYFAAGDDGAASFLATTAQDMLFSKMENPFAASAGAYVLVDQWLRQRGTDSQSDVWLEWIDNLANRFPWLPDGELLRGWILLAGRTRSVKMARDAFVEAERRGIPVYTAGVRRLADGLARIANQDKADGREDRAVVEALKRVRRLAWSTDPRFPFTTIRLFPSARSAFGSTRFD